MKTFVQSYLWTVLLLLILLNDHKVIGANVDNNSEEQPNERGNSHSRQKRLLWITTDGRFALPPGTKLVITPSLSLPFVRKPPKGFSTDIDISLPFTIRFDDLGLTDNQNPFGAFPPILSRNMGKQMGSVFTNYVAHLINGRRSTRSVPTLPKPINSYFQGGERALLYIAVEDLLTNFGMDGKACLLRAICEVHGHKAIHKFGFIGEILQLFLTASKSMYAHLIKDYVTAETVGKHSKECYPYFKECPKSLFTNNHNYSKNDPSFEDEDESMLIDDCDDRKIDNGSRNDNEITNNRTKSASLSSVTKVIVNPTQVAM